MHTADQILVKMKARGSRRNVEGMAQFGIVSANAFGVSAPVLRAMAKQIGRNHKVAASLWRTGFLEARVLAAFIDEPERVTEAQMDRWAREFDSWAVCDGVCLHLFVKTPYAHRKAIQWWKDEREYVRRAGFTLMACLAVHDKEASDKRFEKYFQCIRGLRWMRGTSSRRQ
jgi:3-methyladenine DNA glycosylase AlkD